MTIKISITYNITTHESASEGDVAEHGWWMPGGWEYALSDSEGHHQDVLDQAKAGAFDLELGEAIHNAKDKGCTEIQISGDSLSAYSVDPPCDRAFIEQGEERRYCLHVSGCSQGSLKRIQRLLEG